MFKWKRALVSLAGVVATAALPRPVQAQRYPPADVLISDLRLSGGLFDRVTGGQAEFSHSIVATASDGQVGSEDGPRFERFAVATGFEWNLPEVTPEELSPIAIAGGRLFATARDRGDIYVSDDGRTFTFTGTLPYPVYLGSAYGTPGGALLVSTGDPWSQNERRFVWRSEDQGRTFAPVLQPRVGIPSIWNWTALGATIYLSEYGKKTVDGEGNARRIYRSDDDGRTWRVVYDPPPQDQAHCHKLLADPWTGCVFQAYGDSRERIVMSCDGGQTWEQAQSSFQPTGGVARSDGLYWGQEGIGLPGVQKYDRLTGQWTCAFQPWFYEDRDANIFSLLAQDGVIYVPFSSERHEMWASLDGEHWTFLHGRFHDGDDWGIRNLVGFYGQWIHAFYILGSSPSYSHGYLKFRPGRVATVGGLRVEASARNLLETAQSSSAESGLEGWVGKIHTRLTWDASRSYDGRASIRVDSPDGYPVVECPPLPVSVTPGALLEAQIHLLGDERTLMVALHDELSAQSGNRLSASPFDDWTTARCSMIVQAPYNRIRLRLDYTQYASGPLTFWIDGYQITEAQTGRTWVPGAVPRAGEVLRNSVPFGPEWTDFLCFNPEFNSIEPDDRRRTIKAWVQDPDNYARLAFDPADKMLKLIQVVAQVPEVLCQAGPIEFQPGWVHRIAVRSTSDACNLHVRVGTAVDYTASGPPLSIQPTELWIGSSPIGDDQAPGIYALSRTFGTALGEQDVQRELAFISDPGDQDSDGDVDRSDYRAAPDCLTGPVPASLRPACQPFDFDGDHDVDLLDVWALQLVFTAP